MILLRCECTISRSVYYIHDGGKRYTLNQALPMTLNKFDLFALTKTHYKSYNMYMCSGEGGRSTTHFCLYNTYYYNNPSSRWLHYFPNRDLLPDILILNYICTLLITDTCYVKVTPRCVP